MKKDKGIYKSNSKKASRLLLVTGTIALGFEIVATGLTLAGIFTQNDLLKTVGYTSIGLTGGVSVTSYIAEGTVSKKEDEIKQLLEQNNSEQQL